MSHEIEHDVGGGGILANKLLWICIGLGIFITVAFILPTPQSVVDTVEKYGFAKKMIDWEVAHDTHDAAKKAMIVLGIIPMAVIYFATEALPIGLTGCSYWGSWPWGWLWWTWGCTNGWPVGSWVGPRGFWFPFLSCVSACPWWVPLSRPMPCVRS
jgi:hypothetical protein